MLQEPEVVWQGVKFEAEAEAEVEVQLVLVVASDLLVRVFFPDV